LSRLNVSESIANIGREEYFSVGSNPKDGHAGGLASRLMRTFLADGVPPKINSGVVVTGSPIVYLPEAADPASPLLVDHWLKNCESNRLFQLRFQTVQS
jgi:hypothetical protein